jgi:2-keto-3-deoxy-L-rhamnonate aldolase RhmA
MTRPDASTFRKLAPVAALKSGQGTVGMFIVSASSLIAEACATRGMDWLVLDMEASPAGRMELLGMLQALNGRDVLGLVRVAVNDQQMIEAALDAGANGIVVPKVSNAHEAAAVVRAAKYPPGGVRGVNPIRSSGYFGDMARYFREADDRTVVAVQIETAAALLHLDEIAGTPGVDILFVGCGDLAAELGRIGEVDHPDVQAAVAQVLRACHAAGKIPGIFAYSIELARRYYELGYRFIAIGNDVKMMLGSIEESLRAFDGSAKPEVSATLEANESSTFGIELETT